MKLGSQPDFIRRGFNRTPDLCPRCGAYKPSRDWTLCRGCLIDKRAQDTADNLERLFRDTAKR